MKNIHTALWVSLFLCASCSQRINKTATKNTTAPNATKDAISNPSQQMLSAKLRIEPEVKQGNPIGLKFTVYNNTDQSQKFCKWHTPFEPLMSKYLDITDANGTEAAYKGPMAKRVMPPPASSYISLAPGDSISISVNLLDAYDIAQPSTYTVYYNAAAISGVTVAERVSFVLKP